MRRVAVFVLLAAAGMGSSTDVRAQDSASSLPEGEGKAQVVRLCAGCHDWNLITERRETVAGWTSILNQYSAEGTEQERKLAIAYLAEHFGPAAPSHQDASAGPAASSASSAALTPVPAASPTPAPAQSAAHAPAGPAQPVDTAAYETRCGSCHGPKMLGGSGPANLAYIRFHTDVEVAALVRNGRPKMPPMQIPEAEMRQILAAIRVLAGTNPAMATGGFTGRRGGSAQTRSNRPGAYAANAGGGGRDGRGGESAVQPPLTIKLADGSSLTGTMMAQSEFDAALLSDGKFRLLSRNGNVYREKAVEPKSDWLNYDGATGGNRYSDLKEINTANIQQLGPAWMFPMPNSPRLEVTPVVVDGIMYVTGWNEVIALDATTGRQLWAYNEPHTEGILSEGGAGANGDGAVGGDRLFAITDHAHLLAFDRFTGRKLWDVEQGSIHDSYSATAAPLVVGDLVLAGIAGGEEGARGFLDAYNAATGERVWRFWTIPKPGEKGSESWVGQALDHGCGATWLTGSYDPTLDLVYWAVGNPCPDFTADERGGDNLYTNSVVALAAKTGEMKWYYQFSPHDTHDWDAVQPLLLVDETWQGRPRKLLFHADRNGFFYALDRVTGEVLLHEPFVGKQTWNLGFTKEGKPIIDPRSISTREGSAVCPSSGTNWWTMSFSPITKLFYLRAADSCTIVTSHEDPLGASGNRWFGRGTPSDPQKAQAALAELTSNYQTGTFIRALDPFTGKKVWDYPLSGRTGVLTTAGGLLFVGGGGGLMALDAKTGGQVWHVNLGQTTQSNPMTYMVGGKQYIALPGVGVIVAYALR